jgi:hypothetical protein
LAITRTRAVVAFATFICFAGAAVAQARTSFEVTASSARAGDLVPFTISGVDGSLTYEVQVDGTAVLDGDGDGDVAGTFTMPDLGDDPYAVTVAATIWRPHRRTTISTELDYLGPAPPVASPPAEDPAPTISVGAQGDPSSQPAAPKSAKRPSPSAVQKKPSSGRRKDERSRRIEPRRRVARSRERRASARGRHRHDHRRHHRVTRSRRFHHRKHRTGRAGGSSEPSAVEPKTASPAVLVVARPVVHESPVATVVPALLALAALSLAGTVVLRRRRLASRSRGN